MGGAMGPMVVAYRREYAMAIHAVWPTGVRFCCDHCGELVAYERGPNGGPAGYGQYGDKVICFLCCGYLDAKAMQASGKATLYVVPKGVGGYEVTNWPGTLRLAVHASKRGRHNMAGTRLDVWFTGPDGLPWHGVNLGDNQIARCHRVKG